MVALREEQQQMKRELHEKEDQFGIINGKVQQLKKRKETLREEVVIILYYLLCCTINFSWKK